MSINLSVPDHHVERELKPRIMVIGVGGAGGNAVNDMIASQLEGVEFLVANTDAQALQGSNAERRVQMGASITRGLGAGARPEVGRAAAEETLSEIVEHLDGCNMAFIAAGMGGGTGTGAAPVIAQAAREHGVLTVGVVTKPFHFEGIHRMRQAEAGIEELEQYVDTLIVIPNQNLFRVANEKTTFADAFRMADEVLYSGVRGVTDLMVMPGMINLDFADIRSVMGEMGKAMMGTGEAEGERRALDAAEAAIANPLLDDSSMKGARGVLINITGGSDMTLFEVDEAANRIRSEVDEEAYIIFGSAFDAELDGRMRVSVVATGIDTAVSKRAAPAVLFAMSERPIHASVPAPETAPEAASSTPEQQPLIPNRHLKGAEGELEAEAAPVAEDATTMNIESDMDAMELSIEKTVDHTPSEATVEAATDAVVEEIAETSQPESVSVSEPAPTLAAMLGTAKEDAFIPPAPATSNGTGPATPTKPFALSDMINGAQEQPSNVASMTGRKSVKSRAGSLIDRIMGGGSQSAGDAPQPLDWQRNESAAEMEPVSLSDAVAGTVAQAVSETAMEATPVASPAPRIAPTPDREVSSASGHPMLGGLNVAERPAPAPAGEEDLLDIPAFLRRQAN